MKSGQQTPAQSSWRRPQADQHHGIGSGHPVASPDWPSNKAIQHQTRPMPDTVSPLSSSARDLHPSPQIYQQQPQQQQQQLWPQQPWQQQLQQQTPPPQNFEAHVGRSLPPSSTTQSSILLFITHLSKNLRDYGRL